MAWFTWCSCSGLRNYLWAGEVRQSRSCTKPWGPWSRWWLEWLTAGTACGSCIPAALQRRKASGARTLVLDVFQLWVCAVCPPPLRELGRRRTIDLEDEGKSPEITWILASLSLMMLEMSVHLGSGMKQLRIMVRENTLRNYTDSSLLLGAPFRQHHTDKTPLKHFTAILHSTLHSFTHLSRCK